LLPLSQVTITILKNIMLPAKVRGIVRPANHVTIAAIVLKTGAVAAFAGKSFSLTGTN
jgi:hypothetical protein